MNATAKKNCTVACLAGFTVLWVFLMGLGGRTTAVPESPEDFKADGSLLVKVKHVDKKKESFDDIALSVEVVDRNGGVVGGLEAKDFAVFEDGKPVAVKRFSSAGQQSVRSYLVIDHSGSMGGPKIVGAKHAARAFLDLLRDGRDHLGVLFFDDQFTEVLPPGPLDAARRDAAQRAINGLSARGGTRLYDAVERALASMRDVSGRKILVVMTDGVDDGRDAKQRRRIIERSRELNLPLYLIGLGTGGVGDVDEPSMRELADGTNGEYVFTPSPEQLKEIYKKIGKGLQDEYGLVYDSPSRRRDGLARSILVRVRSGPAGASAAAQYQVDGILSPGGNEAEPAQVGGPPSPTETRPSPFAVVFFPLLTVLGLLFGVPYFLWLRPRGETPPPPPAPTAPVRQGPGPSASARVAPAPAQASPPKPPPAPASTAKDGCPGCGRAAPGSSGQRYCMICDRTF